MGIRKLKMMITRAAYAGMAMAMAMALALQGCLFSGSGPSPVPGATNRGHYTIAVSSPLQRLHMDSTYGVTWTASDSAGSDQVGISLYQEDRFVANLASLLSVTGSYSWSLASTRSATAYKFGSGAGYRLRFVSSSDSAKWDYSPTFTIWSDYSGSLSITAPSAGETIRMDSNYVIRWLAMGKIGTPLGIQLFKDTVLARTITISASGNATAATGNGSYTWSGVKTSLGSGSDYRVRVFSTDDPSISALSAAFAITTAFSGSYTISYPRATDTLPAGSAGKVRWSVTGSPGASVNIALFRDSALVSNLSSSISASADSLSWSITAGTATSSRYRIRIMSVLDPGLSAWSEYFTIKGADMDEYESDGTVKEANDIGVDGKPQQHTLTLQDMDWVRFESAKGKKYLVSVRAAFSLYANMADSNGSSVNGLQSGLNVQIVHNPAKVGSQFVRVYASGTSTAYGPYTIAVTEFDSAQSAFPITFSAPDAKTTWAAGSAYKISWTPDSLSYGTSVSMALYNDSLSVQSIGTSLSNSGEYTFNIPSGLYTSDRYRIRIAGYSNSQVFAFSPFFTISGVTPDAYEPDNVKGAAKPISGDSGAQTRNLIANDQDWVRFSAVKGRKYLAQFNSTATLYAYGMDSNGTQLIASNGNQVYQGGTKFALALSPAYTGAHYLKVMASGTVAGSYTLALLSYDSTQAGFPVKFLSPDTSTAWAAGSSYTATWTPDSALYGTYVGLALYQGDNLIYILSASAANSGSVPVTIPQGLATGKNYRLRLSNGSNAQIFGYGPFFSIGGSAPDAMEPNDSSAAARTVVPGSPRQSLSLTYKDKDWFRFAAKAQMLYIFQAVSASTLPTTIRLFSDAGVPLPTSSKTGSDTLNSLAWVAPADANHLVSVEAYSSSSTYNGAYAFEIKEVDPSSYKFSVTSPAAGSTVKPGGIATILWGDPSNVKNLVDIFLYNAEGVVQTIGPNLANSGSYAWTVPANLPERADYYVKVISRLNSNINGSSEAFSIKP